MMEYIGILILVVILYFAVKKYRSKKEDDMLTGIQVWDKDGKIQLDYTDGMCRVYGTFSVPGVAGRKTVDIPDEEIDRLFAIPVSSTKYYKYSGALPAQYLKLAVTVRYAGKTIIWDVAHENLGKDVHLDYSDTMIYFVYGTW